MEDVIDILLYNSFIEILASNLWYFGKSNDSIDSPGHVKQKDENMQQNT